MSFGMFMYGCDCHAYKAKELQITSCKAWYLTNVNYYCSGLSWCKLPLLQQHENDKVQFAFSVIWPMIIARFFMFVCKCSVYQHCGWHMSFYENKTSNVHWHVFIWQLTSCTRQQQDKWHHTKEKRSDKWQLSAVMAHSVSRLLNIIMDSYMLQNNVFFLRMLVH